MEDFPYRNILYSDKDRIEVFKKLQKISLKKYSNEKPIYYPNIKISNVDYLMNGKYNYILYNPKEYEYYMLSDMFIDICRAQCSFGKHISPYNYYNQNKEKIKDSLREKKMKVTAMNIREEIYLRIKECSIHNPLIISHFIKKFFAKIILDPSSGWGDRLIGSMLTGVDFYYGVDPNKCLHENYLKMTKLLSPYSPNPDIGFQLVQDGFQNIVLPKNIEFDLVYTSPPYFDYEIYSQGTDQSIKIAPTEDEWLHKFLYPTIIKCFGSLKYDGHMVLYFSQERNKTYIEKWLIWMKYIPDIYYLGGNLYADIFFKGIHPIFIFKKSKKIPQILYDPPLVIEEYKRNNKLLFVIRDDNIIGGTKGRATVEYLRSILKDSKINEVIYLGASNGYAPVALAYSLLLLKSQIKLTVYSQRTQLLEAKKIISLVKYLYSNTNYVLLEKPFKEIWPMIDKHLDEKAGSFLIPFGLDDALYKKILYDSLREHLSNFNIGRLWLVAGSGILFSILYKILPKTKFNLVQVGKDVDISDYDTTRITLYKSSYKLYSTINTNVPYPTVLSYDGKLWQFENEFEDGDYIWNVAGIHAKI